MKKNKYIIATILLALFAFISIIFIQITESDSNMGNANNNTTESAGEITSTAAETTTYGNPADSEIQNSTTKLTKAEAKELIDFDAEYPFLIKVNRVQNFVVAYGIDKQGRYSVPYKGFVCSVGLDIKDTPTGSFKISDKYLWRLMVDGSYAQYAIRINGPIMLHSIPYYRQSPDTLESEEYNKLGSNASLGCIRLNVKGIKWIYDNCPAGTTVIVYDSEVEIPPVKIKKVKKIDLDDPRSNWDPTDPDEDNPWN